MEPGFDEEVLIEDTKIPPIIEWNFNFDSYYTIIMYDIDAPYPPVSKDVPLENFMSPYLHWLVVNIKGNDVKNGALIWKYDPPNPPKDSLSHTYIVDVYLQNGSIDLRNIEIPNRPERFPVNDFVEVFELVLVERLSFNTGYLINQKNENYETYEVDFNDNSTCGCGHNDNYRYDTNGSTGYYYSDRRLDYDNNDKAKYFIEGTNLSEREQAYCRCVLHVGEKNPGKCNEEKLWFHEIDNKICYSPYSICAKSTRTTSRKCGENYEYQNLSDDELVTYAELSRIVVPKPYNRNQMLNNIYQWKKQK